MTQEEIIENNELIARFMGGEYRSDLSFIYTTHGWINTPANKSEHIVQSHQFRYHRLWDWLMPVVEKISKCYYKRFPIVITIGSTGMIIAINGSNAVADKFEGESIIANTLNINYFVNPPEEETLWIEAIWIAVTQFIKWYNEQTNTEVK